LYDQYQTKHSLFSVTVINYHEIQLFHYKLHLHYMYKNIILVKDQCKWVTTFIRHVGTAKSGLGWSYEKTVTVVFCHVTVITTHTDMVHKKVILNNFPQMP